MKKIVRFLVLVFGIVSCGNLLSYNEDMDFYTFARSGLQFSVSYPASWDTTKMDDRLIFMAAEPTIEDTNSFRENFSIYLVELSNGDDLNSVLKSAKQSFVQAYPFSAIIDCVIKKNKAGFDYGFFKNEVLTHGEKIISTVAYFQKNNTLYVLSLANNKLESVTYDSIYKNIIDSFEFEY